MKQLSKTRAIIYHLYPGVVITLFFILVTPYFISNGLPPQLSMLVAIVLVVVPIIFFHLLEAKQKEELARIKDLFTYRQKLSNKKILLYTIGLIFFAFLVYGLLQPLNEIISDKLFYWLPD